MTIFNIVLTNDAVKDLQHFNEKQRAKIKLILDLVSLNPYVSPPPYEKLGGDFEGCLSRRINIQHRLVYEVYKKERSIKVLSVWSHYE